MVPSSIKSNLASLRFRERLLTFVWGAACWAAVALLLLLLCGFADWLIDRERETPMIIRIAFVAGQAGAWLLAALLFLLVPQICRLPDELLALWVERKHRQFDHRLIGAVQLNEPDADLRGMSKELVAVMTHEAMDESNNVDFPAVADHARLKWSLLVTLPVFLLVLIPFAIRPEVCFALLARQALLPVEVPHSVELTSSSVEVWPMGED
ncbi:MAG TPA: hypothetical protein VFE62_18445, partial [Gemmataceae bacterium]|nr:hypothetical protein [Gemmataceae bacterium]